MVGVGRNSPLLLGWQFGAAVNLCKLRPPRNNCAHAVQASVHDCAALKALEQHLAPNHAHCGLAPAIDAR